MPNYQRPDGLKFPTVYRTFASKVDHDLKFRVQDLPEEYFDEAIEMIVKHFIPEETLAVSKKLAENEEALTIIRMFYKEAFNGKISVGCFKEGTTELIAVNLMTVKSAYDENPQIPNVAIKEIVEVVDFADAEFNPFKVFNVEQILTSYALCVYPPFRGHGIATEMLKARTVMLKALNLTVTSTFFTTLGSQVAAKKANFEDSWTMTYDDLQRKFPNFDFAHANTKFYKKMSLRI